jgi:hypothetical protein
MASLDKILNANLGTNGVIHSQGNEEMENHPQLIIDENQDQRGAKVNRKVLFTFNETIPIDGRVAYDGIYYLDKSKSYLPSKILGKYILKNHQLTTLYYMLGLENMLFDVKRIINDPHNYNDGGAAAAVKPSIELITTHYTNVGVLSDKVGAGKSYCIMALLNEVKTFHYKQLPFRNASFGCNDIKVDEFKKLDTNIILVPHGLVGQWDKYLKDSGLKYYTVQKAKDVFGLADNSCEFKGVKFAMIAKEDDEIVRDDGDEDLEDEEQDNQETDIESISSKASISKTKTKATANPKPTDPTIKKKKVLITKRTKTEADAISVEQRKKMEKAILDSLLEEKNGKTSDTTDKSSKPTKAELEKEKRKLRGEYDTLRDKYNDKHYFHASRGYGYHSPEATKDRQDAESLKKEMNLIDSKINGITNRIKELELNVGAIKITDIQNLHRAFKENTLQFLSDNLKGFLKKLGHLDKRKTENYDVILVSATFWNLFTLYINQDNYTVNRIIIDECNAVKGNRLVEIPRLFTWLITSSIDSMMTKSGYTYVRTQHGWPSREKTINSTGFILDMIKELYEHQHENRKIFLVNNPEYIEQSMTLPELKTILVISRDSVNIQVLHGVVAHDVLQMLNAGDIDGIVAKLDVAVADEGNVVEMITRKYQDDLKVKEYELKVAIENPKYDPKHETIGIINKRKAIEDLKYKITCIEERVKDVENCPICYDDFANPAITPCCSNKFCFNCIAAALNSKSVCPMCKMELSISKLMMITDKTKDEIKLAQQEKAENVKKNEKQAVTYDELLENLRIRASEFSKYENMDKIFELNSNQSVKKYLIFTEYESTLNTRIASILDKWGLTYGRIRGSSSNINNMVQTYKKMDNELNVLLINSKYFGSGLNLENTSDIIIIHKMQADIEMQVIGRAQRYGRVSNLRVWKLYYQNEVS